MPELQSMGLTSKRRRLAKGGADSRGRAACAQAVSEAMLKASTSTGSAIVTRLANASGLPTGKEEKGMDQKATAARARGDLFFEDISGTEVLEEVSVQAAQGGLGQLDGVEALKNGKKKRKREAGSPTEGAEDEVVV